MAAGFMGSPSARTVKGRASYVTAEPGAPSHFPARPQNSVRQQAVIRRVLPGLHVVAERGAEDAGLFVLVHPCDNVRLAARRAPGLEQWRRRGHHLDRVVQLVAGRLPVVGESLEDRVVLRDLLGRKGLVLV